MRKFLIGQGNNEYCDSVLFPPSFLFGTLRKKNEKSKRKDLQFCGICDTINLFVKKETKCKPSFLQSSLQEEEKKFRIKAEVFRYGGLMSKESILKIKEVESQAERIVEEARLQAQEMVEKAEREGKLLCEKA